MQRRLRRRINLFCFIFNTDLLQMLESNTKIFSCVPLLNVLCGWHLVYLTDGCGYTRIPVQIKEFVQGIVQEGGAGAWAHAHQRTRHPSFHHPEKGEKHQSHQATLRNNMAAKLLHYAACPNLLAVRVYNSKPVHIISTVAKCVK